MISSYIANLCPQNLSQTTLKQNYMNAWSYSGGVLPRWCTSGNSLLYVGFSNIGKLLSISHPNGLQQFYYFNKFLLQDSFYKKFLLSVYKWSSFTVQWNTRTASNRECKYNYHAIYTWRHSTDDLSSNLPLFFDGSPTNFLKIS